MKLGAGERLEDLQCKGLQIIQNKNLYTFTSDSVILANYIQTKQKDVIVEIGTGCGVISILTQAKNKVQKIYAFEIQQEMAQLCAKNLELNNLQDKIQLIEDDVKNFAKYLPKCSVDVVFSNPPYFKETSFNQSDVKKFAKEEVKLSCEDLCKTASQLLKDGGTFFVCYTAERSAELLFNLQKHKLAVKEMFFTENGKGEVKLIVVKSVKNGRFGCKVLPNLITNEKDGNYLEVLHTKNFIV